MSELYTREQLDIELLKQKNDSFHHILIDIKTEMRELRGDVKSQFHWLMGAVSVLYVTIIGGLMTAVGKAFGWF